MTAEPVPNDGGGRPPRRKRYAGKHPRRFADKYKEHAPTKYPETVDKVLASGKTPAGSHVPVLVEEVLAGLDLLPGMCGVDATLGHGGHAERILEAIKPGGFLLGTDADPLELPRTAARLLAAGHGPECFAAVRSNFAGIAKALAAREMKDVDFVFADLGCSSMQLDDPVRGFSFKADGPLDMRMNPARGIPASEWLRRVTREKLAAVLEENADEPRAAELADALAGREFRTTAALADAAAAVLRGDPLETRDLTIRRLFQAVRIEVNEEFTALESFLRVAPDCLRPGGRLVVLSFHSGEDRRVKKALQTGWRDGVWSEVSDEVVTAGPDERRANPRSIPAKLRWARR